MSVSVYLSNHNIQIAIGDAAKKKVVVQNLYNLSVSEGCLLNGVIISDNTLAKDIQNIWEQYNLPRKGIRLVIDSTQFFTRVVKVPKLNEKKTKELVQKEFSEIENQEKYMFDYRLIREERKAGLVEVIAAAVEKEFVKSYLEFFKEIGIEVSDINISLNSQLKVYEMEPEMQDKTFVAVFLDGSNLISTLIENGRFKYFNRTRIFSEHGTEDFGVEIARTISSIMQFHAAGKSGFELSDLYIGGFEKEDYAACIQVIEGLELNIQVYENPNVYQMPAKEKIVTEKSYYSSQPVAGDYIFSIGGLIASGKDINFQKQYLKGNKKQGSGIKWKTILPAAVLLTICLILSGVLLGVNLVRENKIKQIDEYISSETIQAQYLKSQDLTAQEEQQKASISTGELAWKVMDSYPKANTKIENAVKACASDKVSITVDSYDASTGIYQFTAMAAQVTDIYEFIRQLEETMLFADLEYSGYNYTEVTTQYDIHVNGYLSESAGK